MIGPKSPVTAAAVEGGLPSVPSSHRLFRPSRLQLLLAALPVAAAFVALGVFGLYRYVDNFWLYRGFPPPKDPAYVTQHGTQETISVTSAAIGRAQQVVVYLPPGYDANPQLHYPVLYLLHGFPGKPLAFLETVRLGVWVDALMARQRIGGVILVMPFGSTGQFTDKEWANGIRPNEDWETFVARDVVDAIDAGYHTIPNGTARAIAGLSEGGYGALNIGLHHPGEFRVIESWSGYERADRILAIFGDAAPLLAYNSPSLYLPRVAVALRRAQTYVWFYSGTKDPYLAQNRSFAGELAQYRIAHRFFVVHGGHTWSAWRDNAESALLAATDRLHPPAVIP
jgi:enterochelin esterase-like enzyme